MPVFAGVKGEMEATAGHTWSLCVTLSKQVFGD
jgi:hypothetical protein